MLHRATPQGTLLISQPAHAWVSGQLAAAWGNESFGVVEPFAEVRLAAEQHDIGWLEWEAAPTLNPSTGLPRTFRDLPTLEHLAVWAPAGTMALVYGPYVALLVSRHGTGLYNKFHDFSRDTLEEAEAARTFMSQGQIFEDSLLKQLSGSEHYKLYSDTDALQRNSRLISIWDALSLALCAGIDTEFNISNVPSAADPQSITLRRTQGDSERISLDPWPFRERSVSVTCVGRRIEGSFSGNDAMRRAIDDAPWEPLEILLVPQ